MTDSLGKRNLLFILLIALAACGEEAAVCEGPVADRLIDGHVDDSQLHLAKRADIDRLRQDLIDLIWGDAGFPKDVLPAVVTKGVPPPLAGGAAALSVDRLEIPMEGGFRSVVYLLEPISANGRLIIYHQGHGRFLGKNGGDETVAFFLKRGYTVIALLMPLFGENTGPAKNHRAMMGLCSASRGYSPLRWFLEPVVVALNHALSVGKFDDIAMIGISGGGWTTTWIAAIDPRVRASFPVAGSLPLSVRRKEFPNAYGDPEQYDPFVYNVVGYPDLYVLGASGEDRLQVQVLNRYDACCFGGLRYQLYENDIAAAVEALDPGRFSVFLDESHESHLISIHALTTGVMHALNGDGVVFADDIMPPWGAFSTTGNWVALTGQGLGGDVQRAALGDASAIATWTFAVAPGKYQVSATWSTEEHRATNARFVVTGDFVHTTKVNERLSPANLVDAEVAWQDLVDAMPVTGGTLTVSVSGDADGYVVADAIRVAKLK